MNTVGESGGPLLIERFYRAFQNRDFHVMQSLYHDQAMFSDPVFADLNSKEVKAMWQMLITASKDLEVTFKNVQNKGNRQTCQWHAHYKFSKTGRKVHNIVYAEFEVKDGLIFNHRDRFSFWRWSRQALGLSGLLLGWGSALRNKVRTTARQSLKVFMARTSA